MKKLTLIMTLIMVFTLGTLNIASAKVGSVNKGQAKKKEVTTQVKKAQGQVKKTENKSNKRDTIVNPGQNKKITTPTSIIIGTTPSAITIGKKVKNPSVIKIGRFQLPVNPIVKDLGAIVNWDGKNFIVITKTNVVINITVADGAKGKKGVSETTTAKIVSTTGSAIIVTKSFVQKGNGVINPTAYIKSLLEVKHTTTGQAIDKK